MDQDSPTATEPTDEQLRRWQENKRRQTESGTGTQSFRPIQSLLASAAKPHCSPVGRPPKSRHQAAEPRHWTCSECGTDCAYTVRTASRVPELTRWERVECECEVRDREEIARIRGLRDTQDAEAARRRAIARNREISGVYGELWGRTFDAFDPSRSEEGQRPAFDLLQAWSDSFSSATRRGWTITSPVYGVGKSHLALASGIRLLERGYSVRFLSLSKWLGEQYREFRAGGDAVGKAMRSAVECDLLIIDDLGVERIAEGERGDWVRQQIFQLFDDRANWGRPVVVTTNLDYPGIGARIGGEGMGGRITSRLSQIAEVLVMDGPDSRPFVD